MGGGGPSAKRRVGGSLRPLSTQLSPPAPCLLLMSAKWGRSSWVAAGRGGGEGSGLNGGRTNCSMPHPPVRRRPRGEKPLGGGGAFKTKKCCVKPRGRGREEGGGGAAQAACFPSNPAERTSPTLGRGCGAGGGWGGRGGGLSSATVFQFTFRRPRWGRGAAAPRNCSAPSPEPRVRSGPVTSQGAESIERQGTHCARMLFCSRWTRVPSRPRRAAPPRPALALFQPFGPRSRPARVQPGAPIALCRDLLQTLGSDRSS